MEVIEESNIEKRMLIAGYLLALLTLSIDNLEKIRILIQNTGDFWDLFIRTLSISIILLISYILFTFYMFSFNKTDERFQRLLFFERNVYIFSIIGISYSFMLFFLYLLTDYPKFNYLNYSVLWFCALGAYSLISANIIGKYRNILTRDINWNFQTLILDKNNRHSIFLIISSISLIFGFSIIGSHKAPIVISAKNLAESNFILGIFLFGIGCILTTCTICYLFQVSSHKNLKLAFYTKSIYTKFFSLTILSISLSMYIYIITILSNTSMVDLMNKGFSSYYTSLILILFSLLSIPFFPIKKKLIISIASIVILSINFIWAFIIINLFLLGENAFGFFIVFPYFLSISILLLSFIFWFIQFLSKIRDYAQNFNIK